MLSAHQITAIVAAIAAAGCTLAGLAGLLGWWRPRAADRLILVSLLTVVVAVVTGSLEWLLARPPRDPLHLVYAAAALVALPVARYAARAALPRRRAAAIAIGGAVLLAVLLRLAMTG